MFRETASIPNPQISQCLNQSPTPKLIVAGDRTRFSTRASKTTREGACAPLFRPWRWRIYRSRGCQNTHAKTRRREEVLFRRPLGSRSRKIHCLTVRFSLAGEPRAARARHGTREGACAPHPANLTSNLFPQPRAFAEICPCQIRPLPNLSPKSQAFTRKKSFHFFTR